MQLLTYSEEKQMTQESQKVREEKNRYDDGTTVTIYATLGMNLQAQLAREIVVRWALVAAMPDGEDSSGRQKFRLPTSTDITVRACEIAASLVSECSSLGWLFDIPVPQLATKRTESRYKDMAEDAGIEE